MSETDTEWGAPTREASDRQHSFAADRAAIVVNNLVKSYAPESRSEGPSRAVDGLSLAIGAGEFFTLLGPSGCGKTTTLRSIAGLEAPDAGEIRLDGRVVYSSDQRVDVPSHQRRIGMVFQSYAIWPHMTVFENVAFPLRVGRRRSRLPASEIRSAVHEALEVVELGGLSTRSATKLSGGQQQRLALARAMVAQPDILLLDEPLSNLDATLRDNMRVELKKLQSRADFTAVYVTHDQTEALAMSTRIAVMNRGVVQQVGTPREIYETPANAFVAGFIGRTNFVEARVTAGPDHRGSHLVDSNLGAVLSARSAVEHSVGASVTLCVRPENVRLSAPNDTHRSSNSTGEVLSAQFLGESTEYIVRVNGTTNVLVLAEPDVRFDRGSVVSVEFAEGAAWLLDR
jgi:iron(III) transport system ATP-binding protein